VDALQTLAEGRLDEFSGLPAETTREGADAAFGPPESEDEVPRRLGTWVATSRRYAGGIEVWFDGDLAAFVELDHPALDRSLEDLLGPPEATTGSLLGSGREQLVWARRGLAAHRTTVTGEVYRIYAFTPTDTETFLGGPLASVEERRLPRRG